MVKKFLSYSKGFTFIELMIVIGILMVLSIILLATLNPTAQLGKAQDAKRQQGLAYLKTPLEEYFNDNKCYPNSVPFGGQLKKGSKVYATEVPSDSTYVYQTDTSTCPQWYVLYAKLSDQASASCPLATQPNCLPINYDLVHYNFCLASEDYDCTYISSNEMFVAGTPTPACNPVPYKCSLGTCDNAGSGGDFCGYAGCSGNACCNNTCH